MASKPTNAEFKEIFDSAARKYDTVSNSYAVSRRRIFFIAHARGDCLEVGAGTGEIALALKRAGHRVVATDISPNMVSEIQKKGVEAYACDAEKLPFADGTFDTVIGAEMIYYLDHPERFLAEARRVLRPDGQILLSSASKMAEFYDRIRAFLRWLGVGQMYFDDKVRFFMNQRKLKVLLKSAGFKNIMFERMIIFPFNSFDKINKVLELTLLKYLSIFICVTARRYGE